jgi:hypothetical protein
MNIWLPRSTRFSPGAPLRTVVNLGLTLGCPGRDQNGKRGKSCNLIDVHSERILGTAQGMRSSILRGQSTSSPARTIP